MVIGLKIVVLGGSGVGKSTLVRALAGGRLYQEHFPTDGDRLQRIPIGDPLEATLMVHELGGDVSMKEARTAIQDADAVVLVFDCQRFSQTLWDLETTWLPQVRTFKQTYASYFVVANKAYCDGDPAKALPFTLQDDVQWHLLPVPLHEVQVLTFTDLDNIRDSAAAVRADLYTFAKASLFVNIGLKIRNAKSIAAHRTCCRCTLS